MKETVTLNRKEQKRLMVLNKVGEAVGVLGLSVRQVRRLLARYRKEGAAALAHGEPGQKPDLTDPVVLNKGSTALDAAESIHKGSTFYRTATP